MAVHISNLRRRMLGIVRLRVLWRLPPSGVRRKTTSLLSEHAQEPTPEHQPLVLKVGRSLSLVIALTPVTMIKCGATLKISNSNFQHSSQTLT